MGGTREVGGHSGEYVFILQGFPFTTLFIHHIIFVKLCGMEYCASKKLRLYKSISVCLYVALCTHKSCSIKTIDVLSCIN